MKILVCAAWKPELTHFRALARGISKDDLAVEAVGVGLVDAAIGVTRAIAEHAPLYVLLIGTCGVFPDRQVGIGDVVVAESAILADGTTALGRSAIPDVLVTRVDDLDRSARDLAESAGIECVHVANTLGVTVDDEHAAALGETFGADVEHLEAFAVARACQIAKVPWSAILGVANVVGASGREQWKKNHLAASNKAAEAAWKIACAMSLGGSPVRKTTRARSRAKA